MITSLFSKSKPINFLIVFFIALITFVAIRFNTIINAFSFFNLIKLIGLFIVVSASIILLNFIVGKNNLSQKNNYEILIITLFMASIPQVLLNSDIIISNFFVMLALRRILSLRSQKNVSKKLLDAALWIAVAALFYSWALVFVLVVFIALIFYTDNNVKHWIIPIVGVIAIGLFAMCYSIIAHNDFFSALNLSFNTDFNYSNFNNLKFIIAITIIFSFGLWATTFYLLKLKSIMKTLRPSFKLVLFWGLIALLLAIISPIKSGSEFLFLLAPLAIVITNYIEMISEKWFKELFLSVLVVLPLVVLLL